MLTPEMVARPISFEVAFEAWCFAGVAFCSTKRRPRSKDLLPLPFREDSFFDLDLVDLEVDSFLECVLDWCFGDAFPTDISVTDNAATSTLFIKVPLLPCWSCSISQAILTTIPHFYLLWFPSPVKLSGFEAQRRYRQLEYSFISS